MSVGIFPSESELQPHVAVMFLTAPLDGQLPEQPVRVACGKGVLHRCNGKKKATMKKLGYCQIGAEATPDQCDPLVSWAVRGTATSGHICCCSFSSVTPCTQIKSGFATFADGRTAGPSLDKQEIATENC